MQSAALGGAKPKEGRGPVLLFSFFFFFPFKARPRSLPQRWYVVVGSQGIAIVWDRGSCHVRQASPPGSEDLKH